MSTFYLDSVNGSDSNNGTTWALAWKTLGKALDIVSGGNNTVYVRTGFYWLTAPKTLTAGNLVQQYFKGIGFPIFKGLGNLMTWNISTGSTQKLWFDSICFIATSVFMSQGSGGGSSSQLNFTNCVFNGVVATELRSSSAAQVNFVRCTVATGFTFPANPLTYATQLATDVCQAYSSTGDITVSNTLAATGGVISSGGITYTPRLSAAAGSGALLPRPLRRASVAHPSFTNITDAQVAAVTFLPATDEWANDPAYTTGTCSISDASGIYLSSGTSARVLSPVYDFSGTAIFKFFTYAVTEDISAGSGSNSVVTADPSAAERTLEYRVSGSSFLAEDASPPWIEIDRDADFTITGRYVQYRATFVTNGS